jgi:RecG-like helicase
MLLALLPLQTVIFLHRTLSEAGYRSVLLHGKRSQQEREAAVADFKAGKAQVGAARVGSLGVGLGFWPML